MIALPATAAAANHRRADYWGFMVDNMGNYQFSVAMQNEPRGYGMEPDIGCGNGVVTIARSGSGSGRGRVKRRSTLEELLA